MARASRELWAEIGRRFDPEQPARPEWRAQRDHSPAEDIGRALDRAGLFPATPRSLLSGTIGAGKTTELLYLAEQRAHAGKEFVIFLDLVRHFEDVVGDGAAIQQIRAWEVCLLAGLALVRAAEDRLGYRFEEGHTNELGDAWGALARASGSTPSGPELDVGSAARSMILLLSEVAAPAGGAVVSGGLKLLSSAAGAVKWTLGRSQRAVPDQDASARNLLACVNKLLGIFRTWSRSVLFIIDGLDRIQDLGRAKELFLESEMIGRLDCPLVVSAPFALRHYMGGTMARGFSGTMTLVNAPVMLQEEPQRYGPGVAFLCDLYGQRLAGLPGASELMNQPEIERLAYYSGGHGRDFVRMIRALALEAYDADAPRATPELVDAVIDDARRRIEYGLFKEHFELLERIARDPRHELPADPRVYELLLFSRLLPYSNGSEWFYPHPLLTLSKVSVSPAGSAR